MAVDPLSFSQTQQFYESRQKTNTSALPDEDLEKPGSMASRRMPS